MSNRIWLYIEAINFGIRKTCCQQLCLCFSICKSRVSYDAAHIFKLGCITEAYIFFLLNFALKHRIVGTHIRNNPKCIVHNCLFELNCLCLFACAMKVIIQFQMQNI